jgi:uncharacterized protein YecE (DUF72 family)
MAIRIGTCGFGDFRPPEDWRQWYASRLGAYADIFDVLEVNSSFYRLPRVGTAERWRREAGTGLELTLKAWQAITHTADKPTWRKSREELSREQRESFGGFRPNRAVLEAWEETRKRAEALGAGICVLQSPASFGCTRENEENLRRFVESAGTGGLRLAWEPRGDWNEHPERIRTLCRDLSLVHVVDLLRRDPLSEAPTAYIRLHGLNPREHDVRYDYGEEELHRLAEKLARLSRGHDTVYCLFNNTAMCANARMLQSML